MKTYLDGLKFGMLLQIAIGPICLMVFSTAQNAGFRHAMAFAAAAALVDAFYIVLAALGVSRLLEKENRKKAVRLIGGLVLIAFGLGIALSVFGIDILPGLRIQTDTSSIFIQGLIMTLSNPLTIVFWGGVLTAKIADEGLQKRELAVFSCGAVSATILFLTCVAALGTAFSTFLPNSVAAGLNLLVGLLIVFFGLRMLMRRGDS